MTRTACQNLSRALARKLARLAVSGALCASLAACSSDEPPDPGNLVEATRAAVDEALARDDRRAALTAIAALREASAGNPDTILEVAGLLTRAGEAPQALWLLEDATARNPGDDRLRLATAQLALLVGDAARARASLQAVQPGTEHHLAALLLRSQAELALGDLPAALATLDEIEARYPDRAEARLVRIQTLLRERRTEEARSAAEAALEALSGEEHAEARKSVELVLAQLLAQSGETEAALALLEPRLAGDPAAAAAGAALAEVLTADGRPQEALDRIRAARTGLIEPAALATTEAALLSRLGRDEEALATLRALAEESDSPAPWVQLARVEARSSGDDVALATLRRARARHPSETRLLGLEADVLLDLERVDEARVAVAELERLQPGLPEVRYLRARIALLEGDPASAVTTLQSVVPALDEARTHYWLGRALQATGDREGAARRYAVAMQRQPRWPTPTRALIQLVLERGDWATAGGLATRLAQQSPGQIEPWLLLVEALLVEGEGEMALEIARKLAERAPERAEPTLYVARSLAATGDLPGALAVLDEAASRAPDDERIAAERAMLLGRFGRVDEALAAVEAALVQKPDSARLHAAHASLLLAAGRSQEGARAVDRALTLAPNEPAPLRARCEYRAAAGQLAAARSDCQRYLALRPDDAHIHYVLGAVLARLGEPEAAVAAYRRAATLDERSFAARNNLAELLAQQGDRDGALAAAQEAYALAEDNPYVLDTLGALYLEHGLVDRSIAILEKAHATAPELGDAQLHLALAYRDAGRGAEARTLLEDLEAQDGTRPELQQSAREALDSLP